MYITKVTLEHGPALFNLLRQKYGTDSYAIHQLLWDLFPNDGNMKRDFLFHKDERSSIPKFLVVSKTRPVEVSGFRISVKPYSPHVSRGQKLAFILVANTVVSKKLEGKKNGSRHDVWMDAKKEAKELNLNPQEKRTLCEKRTKNWLISRAESLGFSLTEENVIVDGYMQHRLYKRGNLKPVRYSSVNFEGILEVSNPDIFCSTLYKGIGKSKAFGCGLLLIKPLN